MAALLALLAAVGWGSSDFVAGSASRRSSAVSVVILIHFTAVVVLLCMAVDLGPVWTMLVDITGGGGPESGIRWAGPRIAGAPTVADMGWGIAAGFGGGFGAMLLFRGLGRGSMAVVAPITAAGAATIPVLYGFATGEALTTLGVAGILLALVAIVLVSLSSDGSSSDPTARSTEGGESDVVLTVPAGWVEEFGGGSERGPVHDPGPASGGALRTLPPPVASARVYTEPTPVADSIETVSPVVALGDDLGRTVRGLLAVMVTLLVALIVAAVGIAARPVADLVSGERLTPARGAMMAFAAATLVVATVALQIARPLFDLQGIRVDTAIQATRTSVPVWRRTLRQPGLPEALLSGVGFGAFFVCIYRASEAAGHWPLVGARSVSVVMFAIGAIVTSTSILPERKSRRGVMWAGVLDAAAAVLFVLASRAGLLSIGAVLASLYPAVTVLLARTITKEPISRRQLFGLALALAAVGLLAA